LLSWDPPSSGRAQTYDVFGRNGGAQWGLRATTTSTTFHDAGTPQAQYYILARDTDGRELGHTDALTIDARNRLPAPTGLASVSLNGAIQLHWNSNAYDASPTNFDMYRVYSTAYDATRGVCTTAWALEGTTVSDAFLSSNLPNGASRCFAVSALSRDGHESDWSASRLDTPRFDSRNAFVYSTATRPDSSGFLFSDPASSTLSLGKVAASSRADLDFIVERHTDGSLWFTPGRAAVTAVLYSTSPVADLTSIDRAPASGFASVTIEAVPGYAYVFRVTKPDGVHYAAVRVAFVATDYVVFDWSYQSNPGNVELSRAAACSREGCGIR
jgi:hypothetical protein